MHKKSPINKRAPEQKKSLKFSETKCTSIQDTLIVLTVIIMNFWLTAKLLAFVETR